VTDAALLATAAGATVDAPSAHAIFRILDTRVGVISASVGLLRQWSAEYAEFRARPGPAEVTVAVGSSSDTDRPSPGEAAVIVDGIVRLWDGADELFPPLWAPPLDRELQLRGAAVGRAGHAVLLLAEPDEAITRLAVATALHGAWLLAYGLVPVDPDDLLVVPYPKALTLSRQTLEDLGIDLAHPALVPFRTAAGGIEWYAQPDALLGSCWSRVAAEASAMVFLEPGDAGRGARLQELRPREALARLTANLLRMPADFQAGMDALVRLCGRTPAYRLLAGPPGHAARLLEDSLLA
jgi:hypothetical protein